MRLSVSIAYYKRAAKFRICPKCIAGVHERCKNVCKTKSGKTECACYNNGHEFPMEFYEEGAEK